MGVFTMPSLGSDMEGGRLVEWLVAPGDRVARGDVIAVVETQKGAIEIETFEEGVVEELTASLNRMLPVGAPLAVIRGDGEVQRGIPAGGADAPPMAPGASSRSSEPEQVGAEAGRLTAASTVPPAAAPAVAPPSVRPPKPAGAGRAAASPPTGTEMFIGPVPPASPAARRRAAQLKVDLARLRGHGPGGAIVLEDVEAAAGTAAATAPHARAPMEEMRRAIAAAMTRAKRTIPHYYLTETVDVEPAIRFLERRNAEVPPGERILLGAVFVRATALAAAKVAAMNGHYEDGTGFAPSERVNVGVAIALRGGGLVAPAVMNAAALDLAETMQAMRGLVSRARAGRLRSSEMTEGTITMSSLGETGAEAMTGVIFPPQVALVGLGAPHLRPWVVEGAVVPRTLVTLTLSADHRVSDGRQGARFVAAFEDCMARPEEL